MPTFAESSVPVDTQVYGLLRPWMDADRIVMPFEETSGIENMLAAYAKLFTGANIGKVLVKANRAG